MTTAGTNATTCFDWMSNVSTDKGVIGSAGVTGTALFLNSWTPGCNKTYQLVCLQE